MSGSNNLDRYLEDLFQHECYYNLEEGEEEFIKTGVKSLVSNLAELILRRYYKDIDTNFIKLSEKKEILEKNNITSSKCSKDDLVDVGSYNEGTRNKFPDEFDFIFPVYHFVPSGKFNKKEFENLLGTNVPQFLAPLYAVSGVSVRDLNESSDEIRVCSSSDGNRRIRFEIANTSDSAKRVGPAFNMKFTYTNRAQQQRAISVDLVPAATVNGDFSRWCDTDQFRDFVKKAGRVLVVREAFTFTESEVLFMRDKLSSHHRKVYRLLKFLINGHGEAFQTTNKQTSEYSSYILKNFMIHHHFKGCESTSESRCLLEILDEMCQHEDTSKIPMLIRRNIKGGVLVSRKLILLPQLKELVEKLKKIRDAQEHYDFDKMKENIPRSVIAEHKKLLQEKLERGEEVQSMLS